MEFRLFCIKMKLLQFFIYNLYVLSMSPSRCTAYVYVVHSSHTLAIMSWVIDLIVALMRGFQSNHCFWKGKDIRRVFYNPPPPSKNHKVRSDDHGGQWRNAESVGPERPIYLERSLVHKDSSVVGHCPASIYEAIWICFQMREDIDKLV